MRDPDEFDQFYKDVRTRLLLLTYCLTGDLSASRAAVRDAFVVTWHHWRKVSRLEDPEAWTRARACSHAQRRHTAKLWHREKGLDPEVKATLDALGKLPMTQRKVLLLSELSTASLAELSREVGLPRAEAERELQTATAQFALLREVPTTSIRTVFESVREHVEGSTWSRTTIIRRAGAARRRTHTVVGVAASVAALVLTGALVTDAAGVRPTLTGERVEAAGKAGHPSAKPAPEPVDLPAEAMLTADQVGQHIPAEDWTVASTDDNTAGDGLVMPCQDERYADPKGPAALVRTFGHESAKKPAVTTVQTSQASASTKAAERSYDTMLDWFAGCTDDRAQLMDTRSVEGVGDQAMLLSLRLWGEPTSTVVVGVARSGQFTTTTMTRTTRKGDPELAPSAKLLGTAVSDLCSLPEAGSCTMSRPSMTKVAPVPVVVVPAMLAEVDLPPVSGVDSPWVGTEPRQAKDNDAATGCDQADFSGMSDNATRTFLIPKAKLPDQFGLTETLGSLPEKKAAAFVTDVRDRLAKCSQKKMGTTVDRVRHVDAKHQDLSVWHVTTEVTDKLTVSFWLGIVRDGTAVAEVGFVPDPKVGMTADAFNALVERALARLDAMPAPKSG
jgi:DNA-directed RNA polymerase specialized sigma24 family protein